MKKRLFFLALSLFVVAACRQDSEDNSSSTYLLYKEYRHVMGQGPARLFPNEYSHRSSLFDREVILASATQAYDNEAANTWRSISKEFPEGVDMSAKNMIEFGIRTSPAPGRNSIVKMTLSDGNDSFESVARIQSRDRYHVIFDCSQCPFLSSIKKVDISLMNQSNDIWNKARIDIDNMAIGKPMDFTFTLKGSTDCFKAEGGTISAKPGVLFYRFGEQSSLSVSTKGSSLAEYNSPLEQRNTFMVVMENRSSADKLKLSFITSYDTVYNDKKSKVFDITPRSGQKAYYFDLSDNDLAYGSLLGFKLEPIGGTGEWEIDRISFEYETPQESYAGSIDQCTADKDFVHIRGKVSPEFAKRYKTIAIYEEPMYLADPKGYIWRVASQKNPHAERYGNDIIQNWKLLYEIPMSEVIDINNLPNSRLDGTMTHLSTRFVAIARNSDTDYIKIAPQFFISNWHDFGENPYAFTLPGTEFNVLDFGAKGDGYTDDTDAIQAAIDAASQAGGVVIVPGSSDRYGRRYVVSNLNLRSNIELRLEKGSMLWQTHEIADYKYAPYLGHNLVFPGIKWCHCLYFNYPMIYSNGVSHVRITGGGEIRMNDVYGDVNRIHTAAFGWYRCSDIEVSDITISRSSSYHDVFGYSRNIFIGNVLTHQAACGNGDGLTFSPGVQHVKVQRIITNTNDDGIVLWNGYKEPRGELWFPFREHDDSAIRDIDISHSYISAGTGPKAIALILWAIRNPDQTKAEVSDVHVTDCVLQAGNSIADWPDDPYDGRPFDGLEKENYSPVKNVFIQNNDYLGSPNFYELRPTNFISDCGLYSSSKFKNAAFADRTTYWTVEGDAGAKVGEGFVHQDGFLYEGLYLKQGSYTFTADVKGKGSLVVISQKDGQVVAEQAFDSRKWNVQTLPVSISVKGNYAVGFKGSNAKVRRCNIE